MAAMSSAPRPAFAAAGAPDTGLRSAAPKAVA
jgi:hypothetical protein